MVNPLDLFSEDTSNNQLGSQGIRPSSPVQETDTLKELKLIELKQELLEKRNVLKAEVQQLADQWNGIRSNVEIEDSNNEDDAIFELLIQRANEDDKAQKSHDAHDGPSKSIESFDKPNKNDLDQFSAKPSKNWEDRIEFLQKFYKDVRIIQQSSKASLKYNDPNHPKRATFIKTISFTICYPRNVIRLDVQVKLIKHDNSYQIYDLIITKRSNNKLNTIILDMINHYTNTKNINEFLFTLNTLFHNIMTRHRILKTLKENYNQQQSNLFMNQFHYLNISFVWDFVFRNGEIIGLVNVNGQYNDVFKNLVDQYGVENALETLIRHVYPENNDI